MARLLSYYIECTFLTVTKYILIQKKYLLREYVISDAAQVREAISMLIEIPLSALQL